MESLNDTGWKRQSCPLLFKAIPNRSSCSGTCWVLNISNIQIFQPHWTKCSTTLMMKTLFLTCNQDFPCWNLPVASCCVCVPLRRSWLHHPYTLPLSSWGLQSYIPRTHLKPSRVQAGQTQLSQPLLYHTLHLLNYLGMVDWAPVCLSLVCGSPAHKYCTFARPEYSNYCPGSASLARCRAALLFCKDILLSIFQLVVHRDPSGLFFFLLWSLSPASWHPAGLFLPWGKNLHTCFPDLLSLPLS